MRERRDGPGLRLETLAHFRIGGDVLGHHLDRDVAIQPAIACAIHLAHSARSERRDDFVLSQAQAWGQ
jgi:hypothetical protein